MKRLLIALAAIALIGCEIGTSDGTSDGGSVYIGCSDVTNEGTAPCDGAISAMVAGVTTIDAGVITRGTLIEATAQVVNDTGAAFIGKYSQTFSAGCNGAETWPIVPLQPTPTVEAGQTWASTTGGQCGDMPLGEHTLTTNLYQEDGITLVDQSVVLFTLVE